MARPLRILVILLGLGALLLAPRAAAQETLAVEIAPTARLLQGGKAVAVQVTVTAPPARRWWRRSCTSTRTATWASLRSSIPPVTATHTP
jgi:hypothetical protein